MNILQAYRDKEMGSDGGHTLSAWLRTHSTQILASEENRERMTEPARL